MGRKERERRKSFLDIINSPANVKEGLTVLFSFLYYSSYFPEPGGSEKYWYQHTCTSLKTCKGGN